MATKEEKEAYKADPKLMLEALTGAPGKNGPCPLSKAEAAFCVWSFAVLGPSKAEQLKEAIPLLVPMLKNPEATDELVHSVVGALAYLAKVEDHRSEIAVNPVPTVLGHLLTHRTSDRIPTVAALCLLELASNEAVARSSPMQGAVPSLLSYVAAELPRCPDAADCTDTLRLVLDALVALTATAGAARDALVASAADASPPKHRLVKALVDGARMTGVDRRPRSCAARLLERCLEDAFTPKPADAEGEGDRQAAGSPDPCAGDERPGGKTPSAAPRLSESGTYARAGAFPDDVRTCALEHGLLRALLRLSRMPSEGSLPPPVADDDGRAAAASMLRWYVRDYEGVAARVVQEEGVALIVRMLKPPPAEPGADAGGGKKGKAKGGKKGKAAPLSPAVATQVRHAAGCISLLTSMGFHKEMTSDIHTATDQLDLLQDSDDELTRRYAREALWHLKFFEVPPSVAAHFSLTEDDTGEIVLSPNGKPSSSVRETANGDGSGDMTGDRDGAVGVSTRAFRGAYMTPESARQAFLQDAQESEGISMSNMLRGELLPVNAHGILMPANIASTAQALNLARPGAADTALDH